MSRVRFSTLFFVSSLWVASAAMPCAAAAGSSPPTASPGDPAAFAAVAGPCPTFSWGAVADADRYELALYAFDEEGVVEARPRLHELLPGSITAWTPPLGRCPEPGRRYAWSVRATAGGTETEWSESRFFLLSEAPSISQVQEALEVLSQYLEGEEPAAELRSEPEARTAETGPDAAVTVVPQGSGSSEVGAPRLTHSPGDSRSLVPALEALVTGPTFVLADGGIQFPDGSLQTKAAWDESGLLSSRVTGSTLKPRESDVTYTVNSNGSCTYVTGGDAFTVWNAAVHLPQGATVDTLRMYFLDTSGSDSTAWFTVYDLYGSIVQEWSASSSGNFGNGFNDSAQIAHVIDYSVYNYVLNWRPVVAGNTMQLCGFRIFYAR